MEDKTKPLYEFGRFRIDPEDRLLFKENEVVPLAPKVFGILLSLVEKRGRVLDKDELIQQVWADTFVEEGNLARNVSTLRKALGESEDGRQYIETIPRRGYRFVSPVREVYDSTMLVREHSRITIEQEEMVSDEKAEASTDAAPQSAPSKAQLLNQLTAAACEPAAAAATSKRQTRSRLFWALAAVFMLVAPAAGRLTLFDVSPDGMLLADREDGRIGMVALPPGDTRDKELSWLDGSWLRDFSADGKTLLFDEEITGGGATGAVYIRNTDGAPAIKLGEGHAMALSPDGKWALAHLRYARPRRFVLYATGAGEARVLVQDAGDYLEFANWFPDGRHILLRKREPGHEARLYMQDIDGGEARPILQEGIVGRFISPDGKFIIARGRQQKLAIHPIDGGEATPLKGLGEEDAIVRWSGDGNSIYVMHGTNLVALEKLNFRTGQKTPLKEIFFTNATGLFSMNGLYVSGDGGSYAYTYSSLLSDLFLIDRAK